MNTLIHGRISNINYFLCIPSLKKKQNVVDFEVINVKECLNEHFGFPSIEWRCKFKQFKLCLHLIYNP